jgi:hypothetical protein
MKRVEHGEHRPSPIDDPVTAIVAFAHECGATAIAADAVRLHERLDDARYRVSIVGGIDRLALAFPQLTGRALPPSAFIDTCTILERDVCFTAGPIDARWPLYLRADLVIVDRLDAHGLAKWQGVRRCVVDLALPADVEPLPALIDRLVRERGAIDVAATARQINHNLCTRLRHHLVELHLALRRAHPAHLARASALAIARTRLDPTLEARGRDADAERDDLVRWLALERTKFLMSTKADALVALAGQLAGTQPRHQLRSVAAATVRDLALELLVWFWDRTTVEVTKRLVSTSSSLLRELDAVLGELGENLASEALAGFEQQPLRRLREVDYAAHPGMISQLADRMGLASRKRIESAARDEIVFALEDGSRRIADRLLADYDEARTAIDRRFCDLLDGVIDSVRTAGDMANLSRASGPDAIARTRQRIASWSAALSHLER